MKASLFKSIFRMRKKAPQHPVLKSIKRGLKQVDIVKQGKLKSRSAIDFLEEISEPVNQIRNSGWAWCQVIFIKSMLLIFWLKSLLLLFLPRKSYFLNNELRSVFRTFDTFGIACFLCFYTTDIWSFQDQKPQPGNGSKLANRF